VVVVVGGECFGDGGGGSSTVAVGTCHCHEMRPCDPISVILLSSLAPQNQAEDFFWYRLTQISRTKGRETVVVVVVVEVSLRLGCALVTGVERVAPPTIMK